jgi:hypothetical protein
LGIGGHDPKVLISIKQFWDASSSPPRLFIEHLVSLGLTPTAAQQTNAYAFASWHNFQGSILSEEHLTSGMRDEIDRSIVFNYAHGPFANWYAATKGRLNPDVVRYVDAVLARSA